MSAGHSIARAIHASERLRWERVQVDALLPQTGLDFVQLIFVAVGAAGIVVVVMPWLLIAVPFMTWVRLSSTEVGGWAGGRQGGRARRGRRGGGGGGWGGG